MRRLALVLGGARSGKSDFAEGLARSAADAQRLEKIYVATARSQWEGQTDPEFQARIDDHRARRGVDWITIEAPDRLDEQLLNADGRSRVILVDCLTLWLTNHMLAADVTDLGVSIDKLVDALGRMQAPTILVSNEVGLGLVPETALGRRFRDAQGALNRRVAAEADLAVFVAAGLPLTLKGDLTRWTNG